MVPQLLKRGDQVHTISRRKKSKDSCTFIHAGFYQHTYFLSRGNGRDTHPLALETESKILRGEAAARAALALKREGYCPDLILGHPGWGDMLFISDIWPNIPQLHYVEFFHCQAGTDDDIQDIHSPTKDLHELARTRMKNANLLLNLNQMTWGLTPTKFQKSVLPSWAQLKTTEIHDGINTEWMHPDLNAHLQLSNGLEFKAGDPIITFVNRTFEPYRGIHIFMEALSIVQRKHSSVQALLVGKDTPHVSYGASRKDGKGWLTAIKEQSNFEIDWKRTHSLGTIPHQQLRLIYQVSAAHVYFSYPFVLSWSLLEAMSCGCLIIGSSTAPVEEVITHGKNGFLVPFQNASALAETILVALSKSGSTQALRDQARSSVKSYELSICLERQLSLIDSLIVKP